MKTNPRNDCTEIEIKPVIYKEYNLYLGKNSNGFYYSIEKGIPKMMEGKYITCTAYWNNAVSALLSAQEIVDKI